MRNLLNPVLIAALLATLWWIAAPGCGSGTIHGSDDADAAVEDGGPEADGTTSPASA